MDDKPKILIFDLDRTITRFPTYTPFLLRSALAHAPWRLPLFILLLPFFAGYGLGMIDRKGLKQVMHILLLGRRVKKEDVDRLANRFADFVMAKGVYDEAVRLIGDAHQNGHRVILATASHRFYVMALANRLNIGEVVATKSVWDGNALTPTIDGENCYGEGKLRMLSAHFSAVAIDPALHHIIFYSDHVSDLPVFELSDEPVAANPSTKLRVVAQKRGWEILTW